MGTGSGRRVRVPIPTGRVRVPDGFLSRVPVGYGMVLNALLKSIYRILTNDLALSRCLWIQSSIVKVASARLLSFKYAN